MRAFAQIQVDRSKPRSTSSLWIRFLVEIPDSAYIIKHWEDDKIKTNVSWWHPCQMMILLLEMISSGGGVTNHHRVPIVTFDPIVPSSYHRRRCPQIMVVLRASYCSSPSHRFVQGWPLLWEEDFASKRIPSFPPLPPHSLSFPSSHLGFSSSSSSSLTFFSSFFNRVSFHETRLNSEELSPEQKNPLRFLYRIRDIWAFTWYLTLFMRDYYCIDRSK